MAEGNFKVVVVGGAGGIGQPLALQMAMDPNVAELVILDLNIAMVPAAGVAADLSHLEGKCKVTYLEKKVNEEKWIEVGMEAFLGAHLVLVPAGVPRKPGQDRKDLLNINAGIAMEVVEAVAAYAPDAVVALIVNPVNSVVPAMCEMWKKIGLDPSKIVGVSTLDVVRANKFVQDITGVPGPEIAVIGGHAGTTILPIFSQDVVARSIPAEMIPELDEKVQNAGTEVVQAKNGKGSATLSMAFAGARLGKAVLQGLLGNETVECAYVNSSIQDGLPYFASKVTFGPNGIKWAHPIGELSLHEQQRLEQMLPTLADEIQVGLDYAAENDFLQLEQPVVIPRHQLEQQLAQEQQPQQTVYQNVSAPTVTYAAPQQEYLGSDVLSRSQSLNGQRINVSAEVFAALMRGEQLSEEAITSSAPVTVGTSVGALATASPLTSNEAAGAGEGDANGKEKKSKKVKVSKKKTKGCC